MAERSEALPVKYYSLGVREISLCEFSAKRRMLQSSASFVSSSPMYSSQPEEIPWIDQLDTIPIANVGASFCTIIYAHFPDRQRLLAGHFPITDQTDERVVEDAEWIRQNIPGEGKIFNPKTIKTSWFVNFRDIEAYLRSYRTFLSRIRYYATSHHLGEAYIFGRDRLPKIATPKKVLDSDDIRTFVRKFNTQLQVVADLESVGIKRHAVHTFDFRSVCRSSGTSTLFDPADATIYYAIGRSQV